MQEHISDILNDSFNNLQKIISDKGLILEIEMITTKIIKAFKDLTNCPIIINTSFNIRGEPIVNTLDDAVRCFMKTNMDLLVLGNFVLAKKYQDNKNNYNYDYEVELD